MGETTNSSTLGALSSKSEAQPAEKTTNTVASDHTSSSSLGAEPSEGGINVPLGLGFGGLQPKVVNRAQAYEICIYFDLFLTGYRVCSAPILGCGSLVLVLCSYTVEKLSTMSTGTQNVSR